MRPTGVPVVAHTYHGHVFHSYFDSLRSAAFLTAERLLGHVSDTLIAVGDRQRREIAAYGIGTATKLVSVPLGLEDTFVISVSRAGEAALLLHPASYDNLGVHQGTLAVMPVSGGAPREVSEDVVGAEDGLPLRFGTP